MKKYEQIKAKYREKAFPIIDERTFDEAVNEILLENAYLRMLAARALSRIYKMRYSLAWIQHPFEKGGKKERYEKWIDKFIDLYRKAKNDFQKMKELTKAEKDK